MRLTISKSRNGNGYYTTLKNNYNGVESKMYISVQLPRDMELEFGTYDFNCFLSCYTGNDGIVKPKIVVTSLKDNKSSSTKKNVQVSKEDNSPASDPYTEFGEEINIDNDNWLD